MRQPSLLAEHAPDLRLVPAALATWAAAATALGLPPRSALVAAVLLLVGAVVAMRLRRLDARPVVRHVVAGCCVCAAGALAAVAFRVSATTSGPMAALAGERADVTVTAVITGDPHVAVGRVSGSALRPDLVVVPARVESVSHDGQRWRVRAAVVVLAQDRAWLRLLPSQHVRATGPLAPPDDGDDLVTAIVTARGPPSGVGPPSLLQRGAGRLRAGLRDAAAPLPPEPRALLPGLVDGDDAGLSDRLRDDFRATGLTHLVAVSGANVAIVLGVLLIGARWCGLGPRAQAVVGALGVVGFVVLARPDPSVLRAGAMGLVALAALALGRQRQAMAALAASVVVLVDIDPTQARSPGFALSVLATAALLVLAPAWRERLACRVPRWLAEAIAIPAAASVVCAPVIVVISGRVSLVSVPANMLAEPAVAPATIIGVIIALIAPWCAPLAGALAWVAAVPCSWVVLVAHAGARLPGAVASWPGGIAGGALLVGALVAAAFTLRRRAPRRMAVVAVCGVVAAAGFVHVLAPPWPPPGWRFVVCDVGQGDGLVLHVDGDAAVVVDAGPDPRLMNRCLSRLGVRRVPLVLLTHFHADHVEGLPGVLHGRKVAQIEVGPLDEPPAEVARVRRWAAASGVPIVRAQLGETRTIGPLAWQVLAPVAAFHGTDSDPNNSSLVLRVRAPGLMLLLTGDIEPLAQQALLASGQDLTAEVLKIPHHGSAHQDPDFLAAVHARVAIASVGLHNDYGHPSPRTLATLRADGARTYRTDLDGAVAIVPTAHGVTVVARKGTGTGGAATPAVALALTSGVLPGPWNAGGRGERSGGAVRSRPRRRGRRRVARRACGSRRCRGRPP